MMSNCYWKIIFAGEILILLHYIFQLLILLYLLKHSEHGKGHRTYYSPINQHLQLIYYLYALPVL